MMERIPLAMEGLSDEEINLVCDVFKSGNLTMGSHVANFEAEFANFLGVKHAVMVNSGSSANLLAIDLMIKKAVISTNLTRSDLFIAVPAILWPTSLWPVIQLGLKVLLIDSEKDSLKIDFDKLLEAKKEYGERLIGAVLIHPLGESLDLDKILQLKEIHDLLILEDNAESLGSGSNLQYAGTVGDFGSFSFYYSHHMTTVEGGMVVTNDSEAADDLRSLRAHGWTRNRTDRSVIENVNPKLPRDFLFVTSGYNVRPMEFQGALGSSQLKQLPEFIEKRIENANLIYKNLKGSQIELISGNKSSPLQESQKNSIFTPVIHSWMALPIRCQDKIRSDKIQSELNLMGVSTRPLLAGDFTAQPAGKTTNIETFAELTNSKKIYETSFMIGNHHNLTKPQVQFLIDSLQKLSNS
jgi:CDP-6-deoxy-D-xylo-4-hexulose-3-dehydrase